MHTTRLAGAILAVSSIVGLCVLGQPLFAGGLPQGDRPSLPRVQLLQAFDLLTPAERLKIIAKGGGNDLQAVGRGDVIAMLVARGSLASAKNNDVYCTLRATTKGGVAGTIKWVVENGTQIKKGELLVQFDDSALLAQLREQRIKVDLAKADLVKAREDLDLIGKETETNVLTCEIEIRTAELTLKKHANDDADEKDILRLHIERGKLNLARAKAQGRARENQAQAVVMAKKETVAVEEARGRDIEEQLAACKLLAPQDGIAVYYVPEQTRGGGGQAAIVAVGEPVREGQKLLQVPDLRQMILEARVPEAHVARVRLDQKATVRVDAFPNKTLEGRVHWIDSAASAPDFFASDVKVYLVKLALKADAINLKPGMSGEVTIETGRAAGALTVPVQAVARSGAKSYCYVKNGGELRKAEVTPGLRDELRVEIKAGLKEGDEVLRDPVGTLRRLLVPMPGPAGADAAKPGQAQAIHVRSERIVDPDKSRMKWVESYGLTSADLRQIMSLPPVLQAVPVRQFAQEVRHLQHMHQGVAVGATPELADVLPLSLEAGRFLTAEDMADRRSVAVIGADVAATLFPGEDPLGQSVVLNKESYVVVGVLDDRGDLGAQARRRSIYVPLTTCQARFGEKVIIRNAGVRRAEAVQISDIYVTVRDPQNRQPTVEAIRELLQQAHDKQDWSVRVLQNGE